MKKVNETTFKKLKNIFVCTNIFEIELIKEIARQEDALTTIVIFDNFL